MLCMLYRAALHLQIASVHMGQQSQQARADPHALCLSGRAVESVQTLQSSAERDLFAEQQQQAAAAATSAHTDFAHAAEAAVAASCEMAQKLLQQLHRLSAATIADLMVCMKAEWCVFMVMLHDLQ